MREWHVSPSKSIKEIGVAFLVNGNETCGLVVTIQNIEKVVTGLLLVE